jgi:hypothetical protein
MENITASTTSFNYQEFSNYLDDIEAEVSPRQMLDDLNASLDSLDIELNEYNEKLKEGDKKTKRKMAVSAMEAYNLNLLAQDEDFNVRTLALCNPAISPSILDQATDDAISSDDKYTLMIVANNPSATSSTLNKIFDFGGDELEICNALLAHPNADEILKFKLNQEKVTKQ